MLHRVYLDAIKNKESILASVKDLNYDKILDTARSQWVNYEPKEKECLSVGIDGSWNKRSFQGLDFYVVDAVAVDSTNVIKAVEWYYGLGVTRAEILEKKGLDLEAKVTEQVIHQDQADIVSVDGSIASRLVNGKIAEDEQFLDAIKSHDKVAFVSKNSDTMKQFRFLYSLAADMYYYNHIGHKAGFSLPFEDPKFEDFGKVVEVYARLKEYTPLIKMEVTRSVGEPEIKNILDMLSYHSVSGYPYCLKLAHNNCKVKNEDLDRLASIYGLKNEPGSRDALNE